MPDYSIETARSWAQGAKSSANLVEREAAKALLDLLPTETMADVEWDYEKHYLAGATAHTGLAVVMLWEDTDETGQIICLDSAWPPEQLTPNGRRYELREIGDLPGYAPDPKPGAVSWLVTAEEAEYAPVGTIIARSGSEPYLMDEDLGWVTIAGESTHEHIAANLPWRVLRWGWKL